MKSWISKVSLHGIDSIPNDVNGPLNSRTTNNAFRSGALNKNKFFVSAAPAASIFPLFIPIFHTEKTFHGLYNLKNLYTYVRMHTKGTIIVVSSMEDFS